MPFFSKPIVPKKIREKEARENLTSAIKRLNKTRREKQQENLKRQKAYKKKLHILQQKLNNMNMDTEKRIDKLEERLKRLSPLHNKTKRVPAHHNKKYSPKIDSKELQKNIDLEEKFSILRGGKYKTKRYKKYKY